MQRERIALASFNFSRVTTESTASTYREVHIYNQKREKEVEVALCKRLTIYWQAPIYFPSLSLLHISPPLQLMYTRKRNRKKQKYIYKFNMFFNLKLVCTARAAGIAREKENRIIYRFLDVKHILKMCFPLASYRKFDFSGLLLHY